MSDYDDEEMDVNLSETLCGETEDGLRTVLVRAGDSDKEARTTSFVASTDASDRAGDVVRQDWRLFNYRRNPVILDNHHTLRVVGKAARAVNRKLDKGDRSQLEIDVLWDLDNPDPGLRAVGHQHLNGFRSAGSVGFRSGKRTLRNKLPTDHPAFAEPTKIERPWGVYEIVGEYLEQNELLEFSSATIPMNPEAAQRAYHARLAEHDPGDIDGRLRVVAETVPRSVAGDLPEWLTDPESRAAALGLLWPDWLERARSDADLRRVLRAILDVGPPPAPRPNPLAAFARAFELLE